MLGENLGDPPDFVECVVEWRRRGADHVRFAKITFHAGCFEFAEQFLGMLVHKDRQLTAVLVRLAWSNDR